MTATVDMRVARRFTLGRVYVDGLFEVFNLFNRTNYTEINNIFGPGAYGRILSAQAPRRLQFGAKLLF